MRADDVEDLTLPVWPTMRMLGCKTRSSGYDAVKQLPPEAVIRVGVLIRLSKRWVERQVSGKADGVLSAEEFLKLLADDGVRKALTALAKETAEAPPPKIRRPRGRPRRQAA